MTIDEAIENLNSIIMTGKYEGEPSDTPAIKLGIEALKRVQARRNKNNWFGFDALPGETED